MMVVEHNFGVENRVNRLNRLFVLVKTERENEKVSYIIKLNFSQVQTYIRIAEKARLDALMPIE